MIYRFSISWPRVEPKPGVYNEKAIRGYVEMARRLKAGGIEPVICLWHFTFPSWLYDKKNPGKSNWLHPEVRERWNAYVEKMVRATSPYVKFCMYHSRFEAFRVAMPFSVIIMGLP